MLEDSVNRTEVEAGNFQARLEAALTAAANSKCCPELYMLAKEMGAEFIRCGGGTFDPPVVGYEVLPPNRRAEIRSEAPQIPDLPQAE